MSALCQNSTLIERQLTPRQREKATVSIVQQGGRRLSDKCPFPPKADVMVRK